MIAFLELFNLGATPLRIWSREERKGIFDLFFVTATVISPKKGGRKFHPFSLITPL
jgi:hypothetical protein